MALSLTGTNYLHRAGSFDPTQDWTIAFWWQAPTSIPSGYRVGHVYGDINYTNPYIYIGTSNAPLSADSLILEIYDGITFFDTTPVAITPGTWYYIVVQYIALTGISTLYLATKTGSFTSLGTLSIDISTLTFVETNECFLGDPFDAGAKFTYGEYNRVWQYAVSLVNLAIEKTSVTPVFLTGLLANTRVAALQDLTDDSGNGNDWTITTTAGYADGPLPPVNTTPATAIDITGLVPYTYQFDVQDAPDAVTYIPSCGTAKWNAVWFKWTPTANQIYGAFSGSDDPLGTGFYAPRTSIWDNSLTELKCGNTGAQFYINYPLVPGDTYYIQVTNGVGTGQRYLGSDCLVNIQANPNVTIPAGSILITDDEDGFPATVLEFPSGTPVGIFSSVPAGEFSNVLITGEYCFQDGEADTGVVILSSQFVLIASHDFAPASVGCIATDFANNFYVLTVNGPTYAVRRISKTGVLDPTVWTLSAATVTIAVNRTNTILYWLSTATIPVVKRWDIVNNVVMSDLATANSDDRNGPWGLTPFTLSDDSVFFMFHKSTGFEGRVRRYSAAGTLLQSYIINDATINNPNKWAMHPDEASFVVWGYVGNGGRAIFRQIRISDGAIIDTLTGVGVRGTSSDPASGPFDISNSCDLTMTAVAYIPVPTGDDGLYKIVRNKRNDTYFVSGVVKIPDPFIKTGLLGG